MAEAARKLNLADEGLAGRIREARLAAGLTLEAVAVALGCTDSAISQWESGRTKPSPRRLGEFAQLVGSVPAWIKTGVEPTEVDLPTRPHLVPRLSWSRATRDLPRKWAPSDLRHGAIQPHHPCSARAFALEIFAGNANNELQLGDIIIVDPEEPPRSTDWVLAVFEGQSAAEMAWYLRQRWFQLPEFAEAGRQLAQQVDQLSDIVEKRKAAGQDVAAETTEVLEGLKQAWEQQQRIEEERAQSFDLMRKNLTERVSVGPASDCARIIGVMTEHSKRRRP